MNGASLPNAVANTGLQFVAPGLLESTSSRAPVLCVHLARFNSIRQGAFISCYSSRIASTCAMVATG